jgi:MFS family permease
MPSRRDFARDGSLEDRMVVAERTETDISLDRPALPDEDSGMPTRRDRLAIPSLVLATVISNVGNTLTAIAIPWFVLVTTGSAARTGLVAAFQLLPVALASIVGGALVDRFGPRRMSIVSDVASGATVLMIPLLYHTVGLAFWELLVLVFLGALLDAPGWTARTVMLKPLADRVAMPLERVNAAMQIAQSGASTLGPLAAGVLIAATSPASVLYLDASSFAISAIIVAGVIALPHVVHTSAVPDQPGSRRALVSELFDGIRYVRSSRLLAVIVAVSIGANFLFAPLFAVVLPVYAKQLFDDPRALGLIIAAESTGMLIGAVLYGVYGPRVRRLSLLMLAGLLAPVGLWILPLAPNLAIAALGCLISGFALGPVNAMAMTLIQERVPQELLGRVMGSLGAMGQLATPVGVLGAGFALEFISPRLAAAIIAGSFTMLMLFAITNPAMRTIDDPVPSPPAA